MLAAAISVLAATFAVSAIEDGSEIAVRRALDNNDLPWAEVQADGLRVIVSGTAPTEAARFRAISTAGEQVDATRVLDAMDVAATAAIAPPRFSAEILRNDSGISIIGLVPRGTDREGLIHQIRSETGEQRVADLLETAEYPVPDGWEDAMGFAIAALARLERSKISVDAGRISVTAMAESADARDTVERDLRRRVPPGLAMTLSIAAPRPVITPFTLRYVLEDGTGRFDACSADTDGAGERIIRAATSAGPIQGQPACTIGLGVPSPHWATAAELAIRAVAEIGAGSVTFSDADISLVAGGETDQSVFDRVVGEFEATLPEVFVLHAVLPQTEDGAPAGPAEFLATLSPEGLMQMRGQISDPTLRRMADSFARAAFGTDNVYMAARVAENLPEDWATRVLVSLEALSLLSHGSALVGPDMIEIRGTTREETGNARVAQLLADKLGDAALYSLDVTYVAPPPPKDVKPTLDECESQLQAVQITRKIAFEPGSATIEEDSLGAVNQIADILRACEGVRLEIQGHTDSQGRESMNLDLSQARAESVLSELRARRVLTASFQAQGYGESQPIADNKTAEGREQNRRIEFHVIRPEPTVEEATALEQVEAEGSSQPDTGDGAAGEQAAETETTGAQADGAGNVEAGKAGTENAGTENAGTGTAETGEAADEQN